MGGVTSRDLQQTVPVIPQGMKADELQASIRSSYIWNCVQKCCMRGTIYGYNLLVS